MTTAKAAAGLHACAESKAARPAVTPWKSPGDGRVKGESYTAEVYDDLVPQLLNRVRVGAMTMTQVVAQQYAFDPSERARAGARSREWTAVASTELEVVREMARCLRWISQGRVPD